MYIQMSLRKPFARARFLYLLLYIYMTCALASSRTFILLSSRPRVGFQQGTSGKEQGGSIKSNAKRAHRNGDADILSLSQ